MICFICSSVSKLHEKEPFCYENNPPLHEHAASRQRYCAVFAASSVLAGEDEIREAFYAYSHLGCDEQMWDVEGKEIDTYVVRKLFSFYEEYFRQNTLGEDLRLTLRVPNPAVEGSESKVLLETLESIPRSYDAARLFYGREVAPIFEVILPMTATARDIDRVYRYYADQIIGRQHVRFRADDITIAQWIGEFAPARIQVIPLFEDVPNMRRARKLHIGLFGYARGLERVSLPRAISFTCALYSLGLPPELIAFEALNGPDLAFVYGNYPSFQSKVAEALRYTDMEGPLMTDSLRQALLRAGFDYTPHAGHLEIVRRICQALENNETGQVSDLLLRAALLRRFLG